MADAGNLARFVAGAGANEKTVRGRISVRTGFGHDFQAVVECVLAEGHEGVIVSGKTDPSRSTHILTVKFVVARPVSCTQRSREAAVGVMKEKIRSSPGISFTAH